MWSGLTNIANIIYDISPGRQNPKVKKYLDGVTQTSVLEDFGKVLSSQLKGWKEKEILQTTFDKYCVEGPSQQKYWNEESFRRHIRSTTSKAKISDPAIELLWRSFSYYAYHPLPLQEREIDFNAFKRAVLLLVFQCDDLIGTQELGSSEWVWRNDASLFRTARYERLFRSIGMPISTSIPLEETRIESVLTDAMDVLAMVGPQFIHRGPTAEQLKSVARNLLVPGVMEKEVRREEISILMSLLIRLRVKKEKWGSWGTYYNHGDIAQASPADAELTEILVNSLAGDNYKGPITFERLLRAMDLMPNLHLRFYQLWANLFQPPMTTTNEESSQALEGSLISGAILLFAPQIKPEYRYTRTIAQQTEEIAVAAVQVSSDSQNMTITRLINETSEPSSGYVLLFTGDEGTTTRKTIVGVYFPGPLFITNASAKAKEKDGKGESEDNSPSYLLFQLQPRFRLLRGDHRIPLQNLIHTKDPTMTLEDIATDSSRGLLDILYRIGEPENGYESNSSLHIHPETKTVRLVSGDGSWCGEEVGNNWGVIIRDCRMDIFAVTGGLIRGVKSGGRKRVEDVLEVDDEDEGGKAVGLVREVESGTMMRIEDVLRTESQGARVVGEELKKRIQGFGSH